MDLLKLQLSMECMHACMHSERKLQPKGNFDMDINIRLHIFLETILQ